MNWFERQMKNVQKDIDTLPTWLLSEEVKALREQMTRSRRIDALMHIFNTSFAENRTNSTEFDNDILDTLKGLKDKYH